MDKPVIFSDYHHSGLYYSLKLLFEDRMGGLLIRPIGMDWFDKGFWDIAKPYDNNRDTVKQYLQIKPEFTPVDGTVELNKIKEAKTTHYEVDELAHSYTQRALTFQQFLDMDIDIIVASIPDHYVTYKRLRDKYKPEAKVICQMGNMFNEVNEMMYDGVVNNLMASTIQFATPAKVHRVFYHQEIDQDVFRLSSIYRPKKVTSFVNLLPRSDVFYSYKEAMPQYEYRSYGSGCPDGAIHNIRDIAEIMRNSGWGFHVKPRGDGFGHIWFDWAFMGRPIITNFSDYRDKLGGEVFEHKVTGIDLERGTVKENVDLIKEFSEPAKHYGLCKAINKRVNEVINYDKEEKEIRSFIDNLI